MEKRRRRRTPFACVARGSTSLMLIVLSAFCVPAAAKTSAGMDAATIVRRMVARYKQATTFQETSETHEVMLGGHGAIQTSVLKYKKPNLFMYSSVDPINGTLAAYCDGRSLAVLLGRESIYTRRPAPPDLAAVVELMSRASRESLGSPMSSTLSPVSFLAAGSLPKEGASYRLVGTKVVAGHTTYQIQGLVDPAYIQALITGARVVVQRRAMQLFIDTKTFVLVRGQMVVQWLSTRPGQRSSTRPSVVSGLTFSETHSGMVFNAPIPDGAFRFVPPANSLEKYEPR